MTSVTFTGAHGDALAGRLELPTGNIRACALFAHCFTCSKNVFAATRISRALAERGIAVLRFDFTGLGESEGDFSETNFTSNVEDLVAAADFMREQYEAPSVLVGHSFGGAAVLRAAHDIEEVKAVATIAAPFDPAHVGHLLGEARADVEAGDARDVSIAGRTFTIRPQFLDDISSVDADQYIGKLGRALLLFHSPTDEIVGIDNASQIFKAAKHPKSFVSLAGSDHLVSDRGDAEFVASMLCTWAERYVSSGTAAVSDEAADRDVAVKEAPTGKFTHAVSVGPHELVADEPESYGGDDKGPSPYEFLLTALGTCTSMTMRMYADRKGWDVGRLGVELRHEKIHAKDCVDCDEGATGKIDRIERRLTVEGDLTDEQLEKLLSIADKCPVHRTIEGRPHIVTDWK